MSHRSQRDLLDVELQSFRNISKPPPIFGLPFLDLFHTSRIRVNLGEQTLIMLDETNVKVAREPELRESPAFVVLNLPSSYICNVRTIQ